MQLAGKKTKRRRNEENGVPAAATVKQQQSSTATTARGRMEKESSSSCSSSSNSSSSSCRVPAMRQQRQNASNAGHRLKKVPSTNKSLGRGASQLSESDEPRAMNEAPAPRHAQCLSVAEARQMEALKAQVKGDSIRLDSTRLATS